MSQLYEPTHPLENVLVQRLFQYGFSASASTKTKNQICWTQKHCEHFFLTIPLDEKTVMLKFGPDRTSQPLLPRIMSVKIQDVDSCDQAVTMFLVTYGNRFCPSCCSRANIKLGSTESMPIRNDWEQPIFYKDVSIGDDWEQVESTESAPHDDDWVNLAHQDGDDADETWETV